MIRFFQQKRFLMIGRNYFDVCIPKTGKELEKIIFESWTEIEPDNICD